MTRSRRNVTRPPGRRRAPRLGASRPGSIQVRPAERVHCGRTQAMPGSSGSPPNPPDRSRAGSFRNDAAQPGRAVRPCGQDPRRPWPPGPHVAVHAGPVGCSGVRARTAAHDRVECRDHQESAQDPRLLRTTTCPQDRGVHARRGRPNHSLARCARPRTTLRRSAPPNHARSSSHPSNHHHPAGTYDDLHRPPAVGVVPGLGGKGLRRVGLREPLDPASTATVLSRAQDR
jgi:hypothetical protein